MSTLIVKIDPTDKYVQVYGAYRYNTQLGPGQYILRKISKRKDYPDVLSRDRIEPCIVDAIHQYHVEIDNQNK
jgi:hypothetical protein